MEVMYSRKAGKRYEVYGFDDGMAVCFDPELAARSHSGWCKIKYKDLIPEVYADNGKFMSKTERNNIKHKLRLLYAEWACTDGMTYTSVNDAIEHQKSLMEDEHGT